MRTGVTSPNQPDWRVEEYSVHLRAVLSVVSAPEPDAVLLPEPAAVPLIPVPVIEPVAPAVWPVVPPGTAGEDGC